MTPVLVSRRLTLRPLRAEDTANIIRYISDLDIARWLTMVPHPYGTEDASWFLEEFVPSTEGCFWAIDAGDGLVGSLSIASDLGYWLGKPFHGQGYMTEAAKAAVEWHFAQTDEDLLSGFHAGNSASSNVLNKLGFVPYGTKTAQSRSLKETVMIEQVRLSKHRWEASHE